MSYVRDPFDTDFGPYDIEDPKHPDYVENLEERAEGAA